VQVRDLVHDKLVSILVTAPGNFVFKALRQTQRQFMELAVVGFLGEVEAD
jgi:hypothetical protein